MSDKSITRRDLPAVVKRAAELAAVNDDVDEELPEDEVIRIAAELGLAERHVRQALYEGVHDEGEPGLLDRQFGSPRIMASRAVPLSADRTRRALEDYLVTHEYLQIVRRQADSTTFEPAMDPMSKVARAFQLRSKHQLGSATGIEIAVRPLETGWSHARIRATYDDDRQSQVVSSTIIGMLLGLPAGAITTVIVGGVASGFLVPEAGVAAGAVAGIGAFSSVVLSSLASTRKQWRKWRGRTQDQTEAVLDRLEKGDELRPPPAPWIRKLQLKFGKSL